MTFRLLTYNVHQCVGTDRRRDVARVADVIRHHEPDVVCLQEVIWHENDAPGHAQPRRLADALGFEHGAVGLYRNLHGGAWGNVTLSRFPVDDHETIDLSLRIRFRRTRAALYTRLRVGATPVHLYNLHFGLAGFERTAQIERVLARAQEISPRGRATILAGDTNDWSNRLVRGALAEEGFHSATCHVSDPGPATFPSTDPAAALDKVFLRGPVRARRVAVSRLALARLASDHLPLLVELDVGA